MKQFPKANDRSIIANDKPNTTPDKNPENNDRKRQCLLNRNRI